MKLTITILLSTLILSSCFKEPIGGEQEQVFLKFYGKSKTTKGSDVKQLADGSYIALGTTSSSENGTEMFVVKTDKFGNEQWHKNYGTPANETGNSLQILPDGGYIIVGTTTENSLSNIYLVKTNAGGDTIWTRKIGGKTSLQGNNIKVATNGGYIIAGSIMDTKVNFTDALLLLTNENGIELWRKSYGGNTGNDVANYVLELDNYFMLTGRTEGKSSDVFIALFNKVKGSKFSVSFETFGGSGEDYGECIKKLNDGTFICSGTNTAGGDSGLNVYLLKFKLEDENIIKTWEKSFGSNNADFGKNVEVQSDSVFAVIGTQTRSDATTDILLLRVDGNGNLINQQIFGETGNQSGINLSKTSDGGLIITGSNEYSGNSVLTLIKTKINGGF